MIRKFGYATFWALASSAGTTDAFVSRSIGRPIASNSINMVGGWDNDDFLDALSGGNRQPPEDEDIPDQGGSRFKEMFEKAKEADREPAPRPIANPYLEPTQPASKPTSQEELSVEEQARLYREMTENGGTAPPPKGADLPPPPPRYAKTDRAGRPRGRNRDADSIANTADLYFAQLKRDSSVRGSARLRGDNEEAEKVFADEGIKELESLIVENPYLKGQRQKESDFFEAIPEEMMKPFFDADALPEEERHSSGISYKEVLKQKRQRQTGAQQAAPAPQLFTSSPQVEQPTAVNPPQANQLSGDLSSPPSIQSMPQGNLETSPSILSGTTNLDPEEGKKKIRTLMGLLLKHRGGPGFGKGRLKGGEIDQFENLLQEVTVMLREEAGQCMVSNPTNNHPVPQQVMARPPPEPLAPPAAPATPADPSQLDSMIACVEGAITMYKNSPAELKSSVLVTLRAALASAITTCDAAIGTSDASPGVVTGSQVEGTIAVIEGAVSMYRNSPLELRSTVLITLRAALKSAVATCDVLSGAPPAVQPQSQQPQVQQSQVQQPQMQMTSPTVPQPSAPDAPATDPNSKALDSIYNKMKAAAGNGSLGLRSDLTSSEASELADQLAEMRGILMEELDSGIPDSDSEKQTIGTSVRSEQSTESTVSKYQQMLAKAKAEKAGNA